MKMGITQRMGGVGNWRQAGGLCVVAVMLMLGGCGFRLAGSRPLPAQLQSVYVEAINPYQVTAPPLLTALQTRITRSGGAVKSKAEDAGVTLRLSDLQEARQVLSIGTDGRAIEYRLLTRVTFELIKNGGETLLAPETQTVSRDYSFSATQILPKEAEEARLRNYIQDELADLVLLRVESALLAPPPAEAAAPAATY
ncbi:MAG: LPS assembly lipoprotein LptE [Nevskia sp.]|jgi:LPS-assembly lipoprotein|nr:LPS assembly lipoprotein LptE [Nevskia sp.]